jgi:hypothetical protein
MRTNILLLCILFLFVEKGNLFANETKKNISIELPQMKIDDPKIDSLIDLLIMSNHDYLKRNCFLLFSVKKNNKYITIEIVIYEKRKFKLSCCKNNYSLIGYAEINNQTVFLVGESCLDKIKFTDKKKIFTFKCNKEEKKYPPSLYNPPIYRFLYRNNKITQLK